MTGTADPTGVPVPPPGTRPFRVDGPLPVGTTVLEASAGTGKTYAIEALAVRYVAEGVAPLDRLLLITFGRNATAELRDRVRRRFLRVTRALDPALADLSVRAAPGDELVSYLLRGTNEEVATRRRRLQAALVTFDASTIETTHGFCNQMLAVLGLAGDGDPAPTLVEDSDEVIREVVTDLYVEEFGRPDSAAPMVEHPSAVTLARAAVADPDAVIEPADAEHDTAAGERVRLTDAARTEVTARKRRRGLRDYDDMLLSLRHALRTPGLSDIACRRLRARYQIVLVDEFQDTDPVQWDILAAAFHGHATLILVGDPKQAIYAFRGADVTTYQRAIAVADDRWTLPVNHRSDSALVSAVLDMAGRASLGDGIEVPHVSAAHTDARLSGDAVAPVRVRVVDRSQVPLTKAGLTSTAATRQFVATDVARDIVARLDGGARFDHGGGPQPVTAADIAVLVRTNDQGVRVRDALSAAGVPVTLSGAASVFRSVAAADWLTVLTAVEQPHRAGLVGRAALTVFVGWTAARLGAAAPSQIDGLTAAVRDWGRVLEQRGVPALAEVVSATFELPRRVLATVGGERVLTDVRHVAQALHMAVGDGHHGISALTGWLRQQIRHAASDPSEERSQRLDSDARAVQVLTIHRSKGLQYPIVYAPFLWDRYAGRVPDPLLFHRADGRRVLDVGGPASRRPPLWVQLADAEQYGEDLRLLYVAFTRAVSQVVTWWAPSSNTACSPLHRVLFGDPVDGTLPHEVPVPTDDEARAAFDALVTRTGGTVAVAAAGSGPVVGLASTRPRGHLVSVRTFERRIDDGWQRTSYSRVTRGLHDHPVGSGTEPEGSFRDDEPAGDEPVGDEPVGVEPGVAGPAAGIDTATDTATDTDTDTGDGDSTHRGWREVLSPMGDFPGGVDFGTFVHSVLDGADMAAADLLGELTGRAAEVGGRLPVTVAPDTLAAALVSVIETPLGPLADGRRLRDIPRGDRLDELAFELPLAGGDRPSHRRGDSADHDAGAAVSDIAALLHRGLPPGDVLAGYPPRLAEPALLGRRLLGYLTGSIDAVLRVRGADATPRYLVVDYKTNWLGDSRLTPLTAWHYRPDALATEMIRSHYPLQALLYSVALHRFLRHRQPGYDPERHLGGVLYLFVRGMSGPSTPAVDGVPAGVFSWRPPVEVIEDLSELLDAGGSARVGDGPVSLPPGVS